MDSLFKKLQDNVFDNTVNNITYSVTKTNNYIILHIYNPLMEKTNITKNNEKFYKKLLSSLFHKDKSKKYMGCFNHETTDSDIKYNMNDIDLLNHFLQIEYTFIMLDKKLEPLCNLCFSGGLICNVCTDYDNQKRGYMSMLFKHILKLIKLDKLKKTYELDNITLNIRKNNPIKNKLLIYYKLFNFSETHENDTYYTMKLKY